MKGASMSGKRAVSGKTVIVFIFIGIGVGILVGALFGWQYAILGLGAALGPWTECTSGTRRPGRSISIGRSSSRADGAKRGPMVQRVEGPLRRARDLARAPWPFRQHTSLGANQ